MHLKKVVERFAKSTDGAIALLFALSAVPVVLGVGIAVDSARAYNLANRVAFALDSAALAAARSMQMTTLADEDLTAVAQRFFSAEIAGSATNDVVLDAVTAQVDRTNHELTLTVRASSRNYFGSVVGITQFTVERTAMTVYGVRDVELGVMVDVSGSMEDDNKIGDLKTAAREMVNILQPDTPTTGRVRIGFAPFSTSVNLGPYAVPARGSSGPSGTCVTERRGANAFKDKPPSTGGNFGNSTSSCPAVEIQPITNSKSTLLSYIDTLTPGGYTAGHLGIAWAWHLVSPNFASFWPAGSDPTPYGDEKVTKAVILMTDGMFNRAYETGNGSSIDQALALCANIKAAGVFVYTIGFNAPPEVLPTLQTCASNPASYFDARSGSQLLGAFRNIGEQLSALRLKK